jgi:SAM-dependent methyltransferase
MNETTKTKKLWGNRELAILSGRGIDIGCGPDPVNEMARKFDIEDGDANFISKYVNEQFDFVYSSHCLEHMHNPKEAILEWWKLVRMGGHLFFIVPDEDLYEQGVFPSRFNPDHKATFTISKQKSWSPVSLNVMDLANSLPGSQIISLVLQDHNYDRSLMKHGAIYPSKWITKFVRIYENLKRRFGFQKATFESIKNAFTTYDQTLKPNVSAQIQCIVQKIK